MVKRVQKLSFFQRWELMSAVAKIPSEIIFHAAGLNQTNELVSKRKKEKISNLSEFQMSALLNNCFPSNHFDKAKQKKKLPELFSQRTSKISSSHLPMNVKNEGK